jgi:2-succinyl-6-hydroxy-2,4-cyclohexadiene-1-carboxylate synthase
MMRRVPTTIVLLHGFTLTGHSWDPVIAALGETYRPLAPDLRGHGAAADRRPITVEACVGDVLAIAPERFVLAGYSMGARLALNVALAQPERVGALVLVGATPGIADPVEREARAREDEALAAEIEASTIEAFADRLRNRPADLAAALRGLGQGACEPLWTRLGELRTPVTLIVGERDAKHRKLAERMVAALPNADLVVVPATRHAVHLEAPGIVAQAIAATGAAQPC